MKVQYLSNNEIDKKRWDACINASINGNVYGLSWYLDIVSEGWDALVTNDYSCVFPLTHKEKWGIKYLCQPPFTQQLGFFFEKPIDENTINEFLSAIPNKFKLCEINLNTGNKTVPVHISKKENNTYELNLNEPYNNIKKNYSNNLKRNLAKAETSSIKLKKTEDSEALIQLFKMNRGKHIKTLSDRDYKILKTLIKKSLDYNQGYIWGAYLPNNDLCGGVFFIEFNEKVVFLFSALNEYGKKYAAMPLIIDNFIQLNADKNIVLDFEGSNDENLARFYKSFGSKKNTYFQLTLNNLPYFVKLFFKIYKRLF